MTTQQFISTIDLEKEVKAIELMFGEEGDTSIDNIAWIKLCSMFKSYCYLSIGMNKFGKRTSNYKINNEEVLNFLRDLWLESNNSFVKSIIVTVGKEKQFTEKQIDIIMKEAVKFDIELRFNN